jgi:hypothetical protein
MRIASLRPVTFRSARPRPTQGAGPPIPSPRPAHFGMPDCSVRPALSVRVTTAHEHGSKPGRTFPVLPSRITAQDALTLPELTAARDRRATGTSLDPKQCPSDWIAASNRLNSKLSWFRPQQKKSGKFRCLLRRLVPIASPGFKWSCSVHTDVHAAVGTTGDVGSEASTAENRPTQFAVPFSLFLKVGFRVSGTHGGIRLLKRSGAAQPSHRCSHRLRKGTYRPTPSSWRSHGFGDDHPIFRMIGVAFL